VDDRGNIIINHSDVKIITQTLYIYNYYRRRKQEKYSIIIKNCFRFKPKELNYENNTQRYQIFLFWCIDNDHIGNNI
jgi:hypothetical protein